MIFTLLKSMLARGVYRFRMGCVAKHFRTPIPLLPVSTMIHP